MGKAAGLRGFGRSFIEHWFALLSGGISLPFTWLAAVASTGWGQVIWACMAFLCAVVTAYILWKPERQRVIELEQRLAPRIRVFLENPSDGVTAYHTADGGEQQFVQFTVEPRTESSLVDCSAFVVSLARINRDGSHAELVTDQMRCIWSFRSEDKITIPPGLKHRANLFRVEGQEKGKLRTELRPEPIALPKQLQAPGAYIIEVRVSAKDAPTEIARFSFHWGGSSDTMYLTQNS